MRDTFKNTFRNVSRETAFKSPAVTWDYEGTLTAGLFDAGGGAEFYGWDGSGNFPPFGSITPTPVLVSGFNGTLTIYYFNLASALSITDNSSAKSANFIMIDDVEYELDENGEVAVESNVLTIGDHAIKLR